jgi:DNA-binding CsgD family transcriptional regulator
MSTLQSAKGSKAEEVKRLYEAGWTAIRIANALNISPQGVYWHLRNLDLPNPSERDAS